MNQLLTQATHLLEQRKAFLQWAHTSRTARWHRKLFASKWSNAVVNATMLGVVFGGFGLMAKAVSQLNIGMVVSWACVCITAFMVFLDGMSFSNLLINKKSKKFGVRFQDGPKKSWSVLSKEDKIHLLKHIAELDGEWKDVSAQLLSLINSENIPYAWWMQMDQIVCAQLKHQHQRDHDMKQELQFAQLQSQIQHVSAESVEVETILETVQPLALSQRVEL